MTLLAQSLLLVVACVDTKPGHALDVENIFVALTDIVFNDRIVVRVE
jgi:hypothetical protein